jgi:oxidase EvaA
MKKNDYQSSLRVFKNFYTTLGGVDDWSLEFKFERLFSFGGKGDFDVLLTWYKEQCAKCNMKIDLIPLQECREWSFDEKSGSYVHSSGEFFSVDGLRVSNTSSREVIGGWDQPILTQVGYDGGILGLLRKRFNGVPHYLVEAKIEPGNYNLVQISTTVQATFSNLKRAHKGSATPYSEYFLETDKMGAKVLFDRWMSEDGGRLYNKRNRSMIVEIHENFDLNIHAERYRWVTLYELIQLVVSQDAIVAPHIRGILSGI